ncbi:hypothetical protein MMC14_005573 [Varicellaria rhodocarpa]|nr:hypothetical protein [Varicellaria rhodocarpa]
MEPNGLPQARPPSNKPRRKAAFNVFLTTPLPLRHTTHAGLRSSALDHLPKPVPRRIEVYNLHGELQPNDGIMACGYSPLAIFYATVLGSVMILALMLIGFRRFKPGTPPASGCSFVISAACHGAPLGDEGAAAVEEVQWGVIQYNLLGTGHCGFSSKDVLMPMEGECYA